MKVFTEEPDAFKPITIVLENKPEAITMLNLMYDIKCDITYSDATTEFAESLHKAIKEQL